MTGHKGPAFGSRSHGRHGADARRSHAIWGDLGLSNRSRSTKDFVFGELRTALEALRTLHVRARRNDFPHTSPNTSSSQRMNLTSASAFGGSARWIVTVDDSAPLRQFTIDEDPDHLEEAVLIALDHVNEDNDQLANSGHNFYQFRIDSMAFAIQPGNIDRPQNMRLGHYMADGLHGNRPR